MPTSKAHAVWEGGLKTGTGTFEAASGAFKGPYSFRTRFEGAAGTNPEELLAAAHAACLSMALSAALEAGGTPATRVTTNAACTIEKADGGFRITRMRLTVRGQVPGMDNETFKSTAAEAKKGCPVSQALQNNVELELDAALE